MSVLSDKDFADWYEFENDGVGTDEEVLEFAEEKYRELENENERLKGLKETCEYCPYCGKVLGVEKYHEGGCMKNYICTNSGGVLGFREPTAAEEERLLSIPKAECSHELVHRESGFTTDEIVCSVCGHVVAIYGS